MIKNIVFDIGNVLVKFGWHDFIENLGYTGAMLERIADATVRDPLWNEIDRGVMTEEEILAGFIKNDPEIEEELRIFYRNFSGMLVEFDYAKDWICELKNAGFKVYCLSNMSHKAVRECTEVFDFLPLLDGYVLSCDINCCKPEKEIYDFLFNKYDLAAAECVFIDDLEANIEAAKRIGMEGIIFTDKESASKQIEALGK